MGSNWIESTFCKRECAKFIPSAKDNARCCCGHLWQYHQDGSPATLRNQDELELHWSPSRNTHLHPTDAYGTIEFQGGPHLSKAQYIRISYDTPPSLILELLTREWGLELPKLLISIQGGKTNFDLQPKLKKVIRKGLLKAAKTTGAWVFTGGLNTGVTCQAGEALASEISLRDQNGRIVSVGIAPWGIVERRLDLVGKNNDVPYHPINSPKSRYVALNSHHSFFLLVDNGTTGKYGPEILLRRKLENFLSQQRIQTRGGPATPIVCVVIEGGPQTIRQVLEYITDSPPFPVIVCDGTGRAADILAYIHKYAISGQNILEKNHDAFVSYLGKVFSLRAGQAERLFIELQQCVKKKDLITVFRLREGSELDQSILSALLYSKKMDPPEQLSLALTWNRVDIARSHVFNENVEWPVDSLEQAMMDALINDRLEFVKLLLEQGVSMATFLTVGRLEDLYNSKQGTQITLQYVLGDMKKPTYKEHKYSLTDIGLAINKLMGGAFRSSYSRKKFRFVMSNDTPSSPSDPNKRPDLKGDKKISFREENHEHQQPVFEYPFSELMVWAVLTKKHSLALLMWKYGEEAIAKALIAAKLYKALAHEGSDDDLENVVHEELRNYAKEFETLAINTLDYCYQQDEDRAYQLLTYELKNWSKQTCLSLAVTVNHRAFLSHPCCQILLADLWIGGLRTRKNTNLKVILGLLCPPVILVLGFRSREELRTMPQTCEEHWEDEPFRYSDSDSSSDSDSDNMEIRNEQDHEIPLFALPTTVQGNSIPGNLPAQFFSGNEFIMGKSRSPSIYHLKDSSLQDTTFTESTQKELPSKIKFYEFYNAPITKYWAHSIAFILFLGLFTYIVLVRLPNSPQWQEWYVFAYISTFLFEKIREIMANEPAKLINKLDVWSEKLWNVFDLVFTLLYLLGFALRLQEGETRIVGRLIYCVDIIYWYLKVLEILSANKYLGPLIMIMGKMLKNMAYFVILLLIVLMAFGVCRQSILFPNEEPQWRLIRHIFYQPYFMLYGEVFAPDIDPDCGGPDEIECHPGRWITPIAMSMYLLVANILLINLLIAVFNSIFVSVNAISHQVWMFQRFRVVMEFEEKPVFPPPLIILSHVYRGCKHIHRNWKGKPFIYGHGLKRFLDGENLERLHDFEEECVDAYLREKEQKESSSTEERVQSITDRTEALAQRIEDMHTKVDIALASINTLSFTTKRLLEDIQEVNLNNAKSPGFGSNKDPIIQSNFITKTATDHSLSLSMKSPTRIKKECGQKDIKIDVEKDFEELVSNCDSEEWAVCSKFGNLSSKINVIETNTEDKGKRDKKKISYNVKVEKSASISAAKRKNCHKRSFRRTGVDRKGPQVAFLKVNNRDSCSIEGIPLSQKHSFNKGKGINSNYGKSLMTSSVQLPIITLTSEYTSLGDELETVCTARLSPPTSPSSGRRQRGQSDSTTPLNLSNYNPLRDAEEADYHLMEGIIQRRLHRDSENLAVSLEDLGSLLASASEDENDLKNYHKIVGKPEGRVKNWEISRRHSASCLNTLDIGSQSNLSIRTISMKPGNATPLNLTSCNLHSRSHNDQNFFESTADVVKFKVKCSCEHQCPLIPSQPDASQTALKAVLGKGGCTHLNIESSNVKRLSEII